MTPVAASLYDRMLFLHVLAAMVWVGGLVAVGAVVVVVVVVTWDMVLKPGL